MKIDKAKFLAVAVALLLSVTLVGGATGLFVLDESRTIKVMAPTVVETRYYLVGSMNSWTENESWRLTQSGNAYVLNNKSMAGGCDIQNKKGTGLSRHLVQHDGYLNTVRTALYFGNGSEYCR